MKHGFTLIELLVVITIIVVLLTLLTPALSQALYQAKLVACAAGQDTILTGAINYAAEYKRKYFHRPGITAPDVYWRLFTLREPPLPGRRGNPALNDYDDRIVTKNYINLEAFKDPMADEVDIGQGTKDDVTILASYNLLYGFQFSEANGAGGRGDGFMRIGDRLKWQTTSGKEFTFNILTSDIQYYHRSATVTTTSHPDSDGRLSPNVAFNSATLVPAVWGYYTFTHYGAAGAANSTFEHGLLDYNYGYQDGSVRRINGIESPGEARILNVAVPDDYPFVRLPFTSPNNFREDQAGQVWLPDY